MADGPKAPKGFLIASLICFVLALGGCGTGIVGVATLASVADDIATTTPFGESTSFTAANDTGALVLLTAEAQCTGQDGSGNAIKFDTPGGNITADSNGKSFNTARTFDTVDGESYELTCGGESTSTGDYTVLKLPSFPGGLGGLVAALAGGFVGGGLFLLLAIIFLIVGLVKRSGWKKRNAGGGAPMAPGAVPPQPGYPPAPGGVAPPAPGAPAYPPPPGQPAPGGFPAPQPAPQAPPPQAPPPQARAAAPGPSARSPGSASAATDRTAAPSWNRLSSWAAACVRSRPRGAPGRHSS